MSSEFKVPSFLSVIPNSQLSTLTSPLSTHSGVALIELIVVLVIISMITGMGVAILVNANKDLGVRSATNAVVSLVRYAVTVAKSDESPTAVVVDIQNKQAYLLPRDTVSLWHFEDKVPSSARGR